MKHINELLLNEKEKEYQCHIQFVRDIGLKLTDRYGGDAYAVEIACLLHDIGRDKEIEGEPHAHASVRIARAIFQQFNMCNEHAELILRCIFNHGMEDEPISTEEKIVITADSASKVQHHEAFMLMCKKLTFNERAIWGLKYLDKGFSKILFPEYKKELQPKYMVINETYAQVLR